MCYAWKPLQYQKPKSKIKRQLFKQKLSIEKTWRYISMKESYLKILVGLLSVSSFAWKDLPMAFSGSHILKMACTMVKIIIRACDMAVLVQTFSSEMIFRMTESPPKFYVLQFGNLSLLLTYLIFLDEYTEFETSFNKLEFFKSRNVV